MLTVPPPPPNWAIYLMFAVNLIAIVAGVGKGLSLIGKGMKIALDLRDEMRDLKQAVGATNPPEGLLGDMRTVKHELLSYRDTLIEITAELGLRRPGGRT